MKDEAQFLQEVLEAASKKVQNWPEWRRSDEARNQLDTLKRAGKPASNKEVGQRPPTRRRVDLPPVRLFILIVWMEN